MIIKKYLEKEKEGKQQCQNCLEFGHWTYECTRPQTYVYRPSRTKLFKQNKFNLFNIKDQKREESPKKKDDKEKEKEKEKRNISKSYSRSNSYSSSGSGKSKSYSSGSSPQSHSSSNSSYSSSSSSFSRSDSDNSKNKDEIIQNKKRKKLNEMLDNLTKNDKEKKKEKIHKNKSRSRSRSRSRHRHHSNRDRHRRSRSRSDSWRRERHRKNEELMKNNNRNTFYGEYKLKKGERWKKIAEIEQEDSDSPGRGKNGAFRKRPYQ
jgi:hypothetical protein